MKYILGIALLFIFGMQSRSHADLLETTELEVEDAEEESPAVQQKTEDPKPEERVFEEHDIVTVKIKDLTKFLVKMESETQKDFEMEANVANWFNIKDGQLRQSLRQDSRRDRDPFAPKLKIDASNETENEGEDRKQWSLEASVAAKVIQVLPNGNIVIEASNETRVDESVQTITLTGTIDPKNVNADGEVDSDVIADFVLDIQTKGPASDATKRGFFKKALDFIWPF